MSLMGVKMSEEVWLTCLTHALSTETEEIMGLLLGDIRPQENGNVTALIWGALPQPRCDRQKDRVETNPEQLTAASLLAEKMTLETGTTTRVIGWYHSHPHITVLPSHVDVRTQAMYQLMDSGFIGLIFSCFSEDAQKVGRIQVIAFQSLDGKQTHMSRTVSLTAIVDVESSFENSLSVFGSSKDELMEQDTADSRAIILSTKEGGTSPHLGSLISNSDVRMKNYSPGSSSLNNANSDLDPMDMSEGMQQAMHLSNLETSGAEYVRKEVPLYVLPASSLLNVNSPLSSFTNLQCVLYEEERTAYNQAVAQIIRDGKVHPLLLIHHTSTYQASICKMIEYCLSPAISTLQDHLRENGIKLKMLAEEANLLESEISGGNPESQSQRFPSQSFTTHHLTEQTGMGVSGSRNRHGY